MTETTEVDNTNEINEEDLVKKRNSQAGLNSALDHIFSGTESKLFDSLLKDYTPVSQLRNSEGKIPEAKAPGLSFGTIFSAIGFVFRHPIHTYNLIQAARSNTFQDADFQRDLVANPNLWSFIRKTAEKLPQIGKVLNWFGIKEFKDNSILDNDALTLLKPALTDQQILQSVKNIVVSTTLPDSDQTKVVSKSLELLASHESFKQYFKRKSGAISTYVANLINKDYVNLKVRLQKFGIEDDDLPKITEIFPILLEYPADLQKIFNQFNEGDFKSVLLSLGDMSKKNSDIEKYLKDNAEIFQKIVFKSTGVSEIAQKTLDIDEIGKQDEELKPKGNITDILSILLKSDSKPEISHLYDRYDKAEWMPFIREACLLMERDSEFKQYLSSNKENFALIIDSIVDQYPKIKTWTAGANLGSLASQIFKDPRSIRLVVEGLEGNKVDAAKAAVQVLAAKAMDQEFRNAFAGALYNVASGWLVGGGMQKQELVDGLLKAISQRDNLDDQLELSSMLLQEGFEGIKIDEKQRHEVIKLLSSKTLFDGIVIRGNEVPLKLENLTIDSSFVNSKIFSVSFQNTVFQDSSFIGATIYNDVKFEGSTIDSLTLKSMVDALRKGGGNLNGAKLVGDISGIDLSGVSLQNADFSGVTSMQGVNLKGADLTNIKCDPKLLIDTYNLSKSKGLYVADIQNNQKNEVINKLVLIIVETEKLPEEAYHNIKNHLSNLLIKKSSIGDYVEKMIEASVEDISDKVININHESIKHAADYRDRTARLLSALYQNKNSIEEIDKALLAQVMTNKLSEKLFGEGDNRGKDFILIDEMMQDVIKKFFNNNPDFDSANFLEDPKAEQFLEEMTLNLKAMSHSTVAGKITRLATVGAVEGGIFLKNEDFTKGVIEGFVINMEAVLGKSKLNKNELNILQSMSEKIGANLFGDGAKAARKDDVNYIFAGLKQALGAVKVEHGADYTAQIFKDPDALIGSVNEEWRTGLTKLYYDNSNYTTAGFLSGGIHLDKSKILSKDFIQRVGEFIKTDSILNAKEHNFLKKITIEIAANLFEDFETSGSAEYTNLIYEGLCKAASKLKEEDKKTDLAEALKTQSQALIGEVTKGWASTTGTALTGLFLGAAKRSKGGVGARYLEEEAVNNLIKPIQELMNSQIKEFERLGIKQEIFSKAVELMQDVTVHAPDNHNHLFKNTHSANSKINVDRGR